jgi:carbon storage regulator
MLVIRRRAGESIFVGDDVEIQVLEVGPTRVKLGVVAPDRVTILRKEVKQTREQNLIAARRLTEEGILSLLRGLPPALTGLPRSISEKP